ncbi:MAG: alkaline phosphatase family protein [Phycisphaerae bacterium]
MLRHRFLLTAILLAQIVGCRTVPDRLARHQKMRVPARTAHLFIVDGFQRDALWEMLEANELPNIQSLFVDQGTTIERIVVQLPSLTYPNIASLLTGEPPAEHGILGNQWFDPRTLEFVDYGSAGTYTSVNTHLDEETLHEEIETGWTANVQCHTYRGADFVENFPTLTGMRWVTGNLAGVNRQAASGIQEVANEANRRHEWPTLVVQYFPGVDEAAHRFGPASDVYREVIRELDAQIGAVVRTVQMTVPESNMLFVLATDHSHVESPIARRIDFLAELSKRTKLRISNSGPSGGTHGARRRALRNVDAVCCFSNRVANIHLPRGADWHDRWVPLDDARASVRERAAAVMTALLDIPAVDLVCTRVDDDAVQVQSRRGTALLRKRMIHEDGLDFDRVYAYEPVAGDPLRYQEMLMPAGARDVRLSRRAWLRESIATDYPDFVPQILELMESPRAGDILVFAADDWSFIPKEPGGHGSARASDCVVTCFLRGGTWGAGVRETTPQRSTEIAEWIDDHVEAEDEDD